MLRTASAALVAAFFCAPSALAQGAAAPKPAAPAPAVKGPAPAPVAAKPAGPSPAEVKPVDPAAPAPAGAAPAQAPNAAVTAPSPMEDAAALPGPESRPVESAPLAPAPAPAGTTTPVVDSSAAPAVQAAPIAASGEGLSASDPLAGWSGDTPFLRSGDNGFVLMPGGRVQVDGYFFKRDTDKMPAPGFLVRRARLELAGWVGSTFFYNIAGDFALGAPSGADPVAQSWLATTDDYVGVAPWGNLAMLQVGQFDAPFTFENRTSDKYFDFMERSLTVRAFAIPSNKESGAMVHGMLPDKVAYYSLALLNGDGQNFRNTDSKFDFMGRAWVAPFALAGEKSLEDVALGGSIWMGDRGDNGLRLGAQSTQGGLAFLDPAWKLDVPATAPAGTAAQGVELHQHGSIKAFAAELNVPIDHKYGVRVEYVHKQQDLAVADATSAAGGTFKSLAGGQLDGWGMYGEAWVWLVGDDTILPAGGLQLPSRLKKFETKAPRDGVMLAARVDHIDESISLDKALAPDKASGSRKITAYELGVNYWYSKRYRATFNYVLNHFDGDSKGVADAVAKVDGNKDEHEFLFRLAVAL